MVYPQGLPVDEPLPGLPRGLPGWQLRMGVNGDRGLAFFDALLASLRKERGVDATRVFVMGHSNGAGFCYLLWTQRRDDLRGVAASAAIVLPRYARLKPLSVMHVAVPGG